MESSTRSIPAGIAPFAYVELGKLKIFELWLGVLLTWSLLPSAYSSDPTALALLICALVIEMGTTSAALALDDVTGFRDGVDAANHADSDRYGVNKPLLSGEISERQALVFGYGAALTAILAMLVGWALAVPVPGWLFVLTIAIFLIAVNYSYGLRISYRVGGGELITCVTIGATLLLPYALVTDSISGMALVQSALLGLWMLQIAIFSNSQDAAGDREANRHTVAASVSPRTNDGFIFCVFCTSWALLVGSVVGGVLKPAFLVLLLLVPLQLRQLEAGLRHRDWMRGRAIGFWVFRLAAAILFVVNLLVLQ
jgi:1,4-dihydroxy-2-naphthoate polyprenyltransferase